MIFKKKNITSRLKHKMTLQKELRTPDDIGGYVRSWNDVADIWVEILPITGSEKLLGEQLQASASHKITLRYRDGIDAGMRFLYEKRAFNIRYVLNIAENNELLQLLVEEGVTD